MLRRIPALDGKNDIAKMTFDFDLWACDTEALEFILPLQG